MKPRNIIILIILIISGVLYQYRDFFWPASPCSEPIEFSVGSLDSRFGLNSADLIKKIEQAGNVWSKAENKKLFQYSEAGKLKINLVYDSRQQVTDELKKQGVAIDDDKALYDNLIAKYNSAISSYNSQKEVYGKLLSDFQAKQQSYNERVDYFNNQGGAPEKDYASLTKEKESLDKMLVSINNLKEKLSVLGGQVNTYVPILNTLAERLNIKVSAYNNIGTVNGDQFSEGEYVNDQNGERINIFQFENNNQLVRVLTHELGHALGIEHVTDSKAVMYRLNVGGASTLTAADLAELETVCGK